jgi:hypothetical protein
VAGYPRKVEAVCQTSSIGQVIVEGSAKAHAMIYLLLHLLAISLLVGMVWLAHTKKTKERKRIIADIRKTKRTIRLN